MKEFAIECDCGCGMLKFIEYEEDNEILIEYYASSFYAEQRGIFSVLWKRIKMAWFMLTGKEYRLYDIVLANRDVDNFKNSMKVFLQIPLDN